MARHAQDVLSLDSNYLVFHFSETIYSNGMKLMEKS